jgi:DsbC/DsbD-like thiol-disulfide interchange protein
MPGKIIIFGYENTVVLLSRITPPANLPADFHGDFKAAVDWLVCSEVCIPGKAEVAVKLNASEAASPVYADLFDRWIAQIPVEPAKSPDVAGVEVGAKSGVITVTWKHAAPTEADFFPETPDVYNITNIQVKAQDNQTVIRFSAEALAGKRPGPMTMQAVLGYQDNGGKRRGLIIPVALPGQSSQN